MKRVRHAKPSPVAATVADRAAAPAKAPLVELRGAEPVSAGSYVYDGPALDTGWHTHAVHQLEYTLHGSLGVVSRTARYVCPPHQALWIAAGTEHASRLEHARTISIFFTPELAQPLAHAGVRVLRATALLREMITFAARWRIDRAPGDRVADAFFGTMAALLPEWLEHEAPWSLPVTEHPQLAAAMSFTLAHLPDVTPRTVARAAAISERGLRRLFARELAMSWHVYLTRARLLQAMTLLSATDHSVLRIAGEVGYDSATSLSRALRAWTGSTPAQYRAQATRER